MFVIGELINSTRKRVREAVVARDAGYIKEIAIKQRDAGADMLDVNGGVAGQEAACLTWLVNVVQETVDLPLCLDSSDPEALRAALPLVKDRAMINSITGEEARFAAVLPLVNEYNTKVVALSMDASGPPSGVDDRVAIGCRLVDRLTEAGMAIEDIYVDTCVLPVSTGSAHGRSVAEAVGQIKARYPEVHTSVGLSNVSFGLPVRKLLNQTFLVLLLGQGLDAAILDPCDRQLMANVAAAEALLGRDEYCGAYLRAYRAGKLEPPAAAAG